MKRGAKFADRDVWDQGPKLKHIKDPNHSGMKQKHSIENANEAMCRAHPNICYFSLFDYSQSHSDN